MLIGHTVADNSLSHELFMKIIILDVSYRQTCMTLVACAVHSHARPPLSVTDAETKNRLGVKLLLKVESKFGKGLPYKYNLKKWATA